VAVAVALGLLVVLGTSSPARADVLLGTTEGFAILAGQTVTNTGATTIYGDVGIHPGAAADPAPNVTGFDTVVQTGTLYDRGDVAEQAKIDLVAAYDDAAGRVVPVPVSRSRELAGADLGPGVYVSSDGGDFIVSSNGTLTLRGDADDVWIFKSESTLIFESGAEVVLVGADPCNVFWQVTSSATLGTDSVVVGTIMAMADISLLDRASLEGRALARTGSVTMISNTITIEPCGEVAGPTEPDIGPTAEDTPAPTAPAQVETPRRVDTGAGGTSGAADGRAVLAGLAAAGVIAVTLLRRRERSRS
jgi:hypothetical protein